MRASTTVTTTTSAAFPIAIPMPAAALPVPAFWPSMGTMSTIGTTQRSWKIRVPTMKRPWGASSSRRSARARRTIAVLESANTKPYTTPCATGSPCEDAATAGCARGTGSAAALSGTACATHSASIDATREDLGTAGA
jgi:hypothetical protein